MYISRPPTDPPCWKQCFGPHCLIFQPIFFLKKGVKMLRRPSCFIWAGTLSFLKHHPCIAHHYWYRKVRFSRFGRHIHVWFWWEYPPGNKFRHCLGMLGVGVPVPCKNERNLILGQRNDHTLSFLPVFASFNLPDTTGCFLNIKYHV